MMTRPEQVLHEYFEAVQSHSVDRILAVFTADAVISTADGDVAGADNIREFYLNGVLKCSHFIPKPGPYFLSGPDAIAVEIVLECDGVASRVGDFFTIKDGKIAHMRVYSGKGYHPSN